jgi:hypothetical protein
MKKTIIKKRNSIIISIETWFILTSIAGLFGLSKVFTASFYNIYSLFSILGIGFLIISILSLISVTGLIFHKKWGLMLSAIFSFLAAVGIIISDIVFTQFEFLDIFFGLAFLLSGIYLTFNKKIKKEFK